MNKDNFIVDIIDEGLSEGKCNEIITRFPPEPNGYLHIGHAKALCINFGVKELYSGKCNLRYDDTNPSKEDIEYVDSIKRDIEWLGFKWDNELYASDYFERFYESAVGLIKKGLAYVCDLTADEIRETRGTLTEVGKNSPYRDRSIEENIDLFKRMREGEFEDGTKVLRAKIDMASPNINMRDPVIYRILRCAHHRTGNEWLIYPMYDFAHPLEDAYEGITHSICTLEFEDHRPLYDWVKYNCGYGDLPRQIEFARLNIKRTIMSKRYLKKLVDEGVVSGWSDPRMPTLSGMRERGYPPEAIRAFCDIAGVSKANSTIEPQMLEYCVRDYLNAHANRAMVVKDPIIMNIINLPEREEYIVSDNPSDENSATHTQVISKSIYIEREDFMPEPPPKYKRLTVGGTVRLKNSYIVEYVSHKCDDNGNVLSVDVKLIDDSKSGGANANIRVKGVIQWVDTETALRCVLNDYDYLLLDGEGDFNDRLNPNSLIRYENAVAESWLLAAKPYDRFQFMRIGYYSAVGEFGKDGKYEFNQIVSLKDSYKIPN